jgi:hypothetical protein
MFLLGGLFDEIMYEGLNHYVVPFSTTESRRKHYVSNSRRNHSPREDQPGMHRKENLLRCFNLCVLILYEFYNYNHILCDL